MAHGKPSGVLTGRPLFSFACKPMQDGALSLLLTDVQGDCHRLLGLPETEDIIGQTARQLFAVDDVLVDDWMEFILKMKHAPGSMLYDARDGSRITRKTLQFLKHVKNWVAIELEYDLKQETVRVAFSSAKESVIKISTMHLRSLRQMLWLHKYVDAGGSWEIDLAARTIYLSRQLAQILRFADDAIVVPLERFLATVHPEDLQKVIYALEYVETSTAPVTSRGIADDGSPLHFSSFGLPVYNKVGEISHIVGRSSNVTEEEMARQKMALSEQRFRGIVENSQDIFVVLDVNGVITYVSPNVMQQAGYKPEEVVGGKFRRFVGAKADQADLQKDFDRVLKDGRLHTTGEYQIKTATGANVWYLIRMAAIAGAGGKIEEVAAVCRDVNEEKKHQENLNYLSTHDSLTGVYNRFHFEQEIERVETQHIGNVGLVITDLNGLKLVNDAYGLRRGDELLRQAAGLLGRLCKENHKLFRLGGDEFGVLLFGATQRELDGFIQSIAEASRATYKYDIPISISMGAVLRKNKKEDFQALYHQAEGAMYSSKMLDSRSIRSHMLGSLRETLRARNLETANHTQRMERMVLALGKRLGLNAGECDRLAVLASMHDIGKVAIPDDVISKPGKLNEAEWDTMRSHSEIGSRIASTAQELSVVANEIACHHERWDGAGYPFGKKGKSIPLLSRIIAVVDSYDVMTHKRVYKGAVTHEEAIAELRRCSGSQFDPKVVDLFIEIYGDGSGSKTPPIGGQGA